MKTKDFIKMLQEEDPSGEAHIRLNGGMPWFVEGKIGYWDGPYTYLDEDGNYVTSIEGFKIDVYSMGIEEFVEKHFNTETLDNWEEIKSKFKFEFDNYANPNQREERVNKILEKAKKYFDEEVKIYKEIKENKLKK